MNPRFYWGRFILGFLLAPLGIQLLMLLSRVLGCLIGNRFCADSIVFGGFASALFIFPTTWFFELCFGLPVIGILWYLRWLRSWVLIGFGGLAGGLLFSPTAIKSYEHVGLMSFLTVLWGALYGASTAAVMWIIAFKESKSTQHDGQPNQ